MAVPHSAAGLSSCGATGVPVYCFVFSDVIFDNLFTLEVYGVLCISYCEYS